VDEIAQGQNSPTPPKRNFSDIDSARTGRMDRPVRATKA